MDVLKKKIILASKSPRRSHLLREAGFDFEIKTREVDESYPVDLPASEVAGYLAEKKALACRDFLGSENEILLAADSVVIVDNIIYGKPENPEDAMRILRHLSGKVHHVITGVCLLSLQKKKVFSAVSHVHFAPLSEREIKYYTDHFAPLDKAGAYAIQEWIGLCKITKIEGTYSNIMGLPMESVYRELLQF